jgi:hypothetical protein
VRHLRSTKIKLKAYSLFRSKKAIAIPATFLILFVSLLGVISITYYLSVEKVNAQNQILKSSTAQQEILSLADTITSTLWQPGSTRTFELSDSGGQIKVQPHENLLTLTLTDNIGINATVYNQTIGQIVYALPYAKSPDVGTYLKGDSRAITNQSGSALAQLSIKNGKSHLELFLNYRPAVSYSISETGENQIINNIRIYVASLSSSEQIALHGKVPLKIISQSTDLSSTTYSTAYSISKVQLASSLNGQSGQIEVPITSSSSGAIINLEIVSCNIQITRWVH